MSNSKKERILWVDYVKAFACFLVVLGHLLQSLQKSNIDNYAQITEFINWFIYLFHMPLFMCMSGFLYCKSKKEFTWKNYKKFEKKKIINLLVPYITFYLLFIAINVMFSGSVNNKKGIDDVLNIFNNPMSPYWFLYALLSIFLIIPITEKIFKNNEKKTFAFLVILKILTIFCDTKIYIIDSFMENAIYFYFGVFINSEKSNNRKNIINRVLLIAMYITCSIVYYNYINEMNKIAKAIINIIFALFGTYISVINFKNIEKNIILDTFKKYTFEIYLTHTIFAAGVRIIFLKLGITNYVLHFILGMFASIYIPVMMSIISKKIKYTEFFFYPLKTIEKLKERKLENGRKKA